MTSAAADTPSRYVQSFRYNSGMRHGDWWRDRQHNITSFQQTHMHVDGGRHIWLCRLRHMVTPNSLTSVTPNTVTPHGYAGYATWSCQIRLRHNSVSTKSTTCCAGCPKVMTWHSACIRVVHGMCRWPRVFNASAYENSLYPHSRSRGSLQKPAALRLDDYDRKSPWMYIARRRQQFRLRIQQTEVILASIFDDVHNSYE